MCKRRLGEEFSRTRQYFTSLMQNVDINKVDFEQENPRALGGHTSVQFPPLSLGTFSGLLCPQNNVPCTQRGKVRPFRGF